MKVELKYEPLLDASKQLSTLASDITKGAARSNNAIPDRAWLVQITVGPEVEWMREQVIELDSLAALALMLDTDGNGEASFVHTGEWSAAGSLEDHIRSEFGSTYADKVGELTPEDLAKLMLTFASIGNNLPGAAKVMTPEELKNFLIDHPDIAEVLATTPPRGGARGYEGMLASFYARGDDARMS